MTNDGRASAADVAVGDQIRGAARFIGARVAEGSCRVASTTLYCTLDGLAAGRTTTITVQVRRETFGSWTNLATVGSASPDAGVADNTDRVHVKGLTRSDLGACAAGGPLARAAC